jgi:hypothetical protein
MTGFDHSGTRGPDAVDADPSSLIARAYAAFNERRFEDALAVMDPAVEWPNGMEGGVVHGHAGVRAYWTRQWASIDPHVEPTRVTRAPDGRWVVNVHQVVRDLAGTLLVDQPIQHVYTIREGRITHMEIRAIDAAGDRRLPPNGR